jgi:predicted permease
MSPQPIQYDAAHLSLASRFFHSEAVVASPADDTETIICSVAIGGDLAVTQGVYLFGWCAVTAGTNAVGATLQIRQTNAAGSSKVSTGAVTVVATKLYAPSVFTIDTAPGSTTQVYVLTLTMLSGSAASAVSQARLMALVV